MKKLIKKLLLNKVLQVRSPSLKGLKLKLNHLTNGSIFLYDYEPDKHKAIELLINPKGVFFDIGANIGLHSYFVNMHYPHASIYSFEPLPENIAYIKETIAANAIDTIKVIEAAVSSKPGESYFDISNSNFEGKLSYDETSLKVAMITLDEFTSTTKIYPDLIKIDVEGAEGDVLKGARILIESKKPALIIELHNPKQDVLVAGFLNGMGYTVFRINPNACKAGERVLLTISKLQAGWPEPDGVWGNIAAIHSSKLSEYAIS